jgi:hypothetical protein
MFACPWAWEVAVYNPFVDLDQVGPVLGGLVLLVVVGPGG